MKLKELKELCRTFHLRLSGTKQVLLEELHTFSQDHDAWDRYVKVLRLEDIRALSSLTPPSQQPPSGCEEASQGSSCLWPVWEGQEVPPQEIHTTPCCAAGWC